MKMIFKCKNGCEIYYNTESINKPESNYDFFLSDVNGILLNTNPDIKVVYYIIGFHNIKETDNRKEYLISAFNEFIESHRDQFIMFRTGFNVVAAIVGDENIRKNKDRAVEDYVAAVEAGFININSYTQLEYSQTFVYKNEISKKFINAITRHEALTWTYGCDFDIKEIYK